MSRVICDLHRVLKRLPKTSVACITKETFKNTRNDAIQMIRLSQSNHGNTRLVCTCCGLLTNQPALLNKRIYAKRVQLFSSTTILNSKQLTENEYEVIAEETMDSLTELFEDLPEKIICDSEYDTQYGSGVLTVKISDNWGTYVINKQTPNKQIWLSSPISGPKRYDYENGTWVYKHDKRTLHQLLSEEISQALDKNIDFTNCSYGSVEDS